MLDVEEKKEIITKEGDAKGEIQFSYGNLEREGSGRMSSSSSLAKNLFPHVPRKRNFRGRKGYFTNTRCNFGKDLNAKRHNEEPNHGGGRGERERDWNEKNEDNLVDFTGIPYSVLVQKM